MTQQGEPGIKASDLIAMAEAAISLKNLPEKAVEEIASYVQAFTAWQEDESSPLNRVEEVQSAEARELERLLELHNELLGIAEQFKSDTQKELLELRKKGDAIMAYVDSEPKRISVTKSSKS